jgi:hypothetical protein
MGDCGRALLASLGGCCCGTDVLRVVSNGNSKVVPQHDQSVYFQAGSTRPFIPRSWSIKIPFRLSLRLILTGVRRFTVALKRDYPGTRGTWGFLRIAAHVCIRWRGRRPMAVIGRAVVVQACFCILCDTSHIGIVRMCPDITDIPRLPPSIEQKLYSSRIAGIIEVVRSFNV